MRIHPYAIHNDVDKMSGALRSLAFEVMEATNLGQKGIKAAIVGMTLPPQYIFNVGLRLAQD